MSSAKDALDATARSRYDAIVLDILLPDRSGIVVCQSIRKTSDVPIIMVTALGEEADRVLGLEAGADDYVIKRSLFARTFVHGLLCVRVMLRWSRSADVLDVEISRGHRTHEA